MRSRADITIGGGSANCGKTYAEILAGARWKDVPGFAATYFRRNTTQIKNPGGLWDEASKVYPLLGAHPNINEMEWRWPSTAKVKMAHLERDSTVNQWQGAQIPLIIFDELTHFTEKQFWYMPSRNRSNCGVRSRMLASCNPDADSWVAGLIEWWIEQSEDSPNWGIPIKERAGKLRYFTRLADVMVWGDTPEEVLAQVPPNTISLIDVRSLTFIPGSITDNPKGDPRYRGQLMAMSRVMRGRLLDGNWKIRAQMGEVFKREEVVMIDTLPTDVTQWVRRWDLAATEPSEEKKNPDYTAGVLMGRRKNGRYVVADVILERKRTEEIRQLIKRTAEADGRRVKIGIPQDPGQAGVDQVTSYLNLLAGYSIFVDRETGKKEVRADPFASQWQRGQVEVLRGRWNAHYFSQMEGFPDANMHDDAVDASAGAFHKLTGPMSMFDAL